MKVKNIWIISILILITISIIDAQLVRDRWWQREEPTPSFNQVINPEYLDIKRELEIVWDDLQLQMKQYHEIQRLGHDTRPLKRYIKEVTEKNLFELEHKLSQIPMYLTKNPNREEYYYDQ